MTRKQKIISFMSGSAAVLFLVGYLIATRILFPPLPEPESGITVPSLRGLTVGQAQERLRRLGLRLTQTMEVPNSQQPGLIIAQSPLAGQQLRELGEVRVGIAAPLPVPAPAAVRDSVTVTDTVTDSDTVPLPQPVPDTVTPADTVSFSR